MHSLAARHSSRSLAPRAASALDVAALRVDKSRSTPAYLQLKEQLSSAIGRGEPGPGTALPSERELADALALSRMTVRRAFEELVAEGLVEQRQGSGTYVRARPLEHPIDTLLRFTDEALLLGFAPGARILDASPRPADRRAAAALEVPRDEPLLVVTRLRTADGQPLALQVAHLAPALAGLSIAAVERHGSLYAAIEEQYGLLPARARQTVAARRPEHGEAALLGIDPGEPVLGLERTTFDAEGRPFEFVRSAYRGDIYRLSLELRTPQEREGR